MRLFRRSTALVLTLALIGCTGIPNLGVTGPSLTGSVSGNVTDKTKIAVLEDEAVLDFTDAKVLPVSNGRFTYALPTSKTTAVLAAFEDLDGNGKWNEGEPITTSTECQSCSYLRLTYDGTAWKVTEQTTSGPRSATLTDSTIAFNA